MYQIFKRRWNRWAMALVTGLALMGPASAQSPPPIHTKNLTLRLPVQLDERSRAQVAEIKLYVRPQNGSWTCVKTLPPTAGAFDFKAETDGVYSFTFVTVDKRGRMEPANLDIAPPHRVVIIDTKAPELSAQPIPLKGERYLQVHVRDQNPDWLSVRVAYLAPDQSWQPLSVAASDTPTVFRVPNAGVFESKIRISASDRAGNSTTRELDLGDPTATLGFSNKSTVTQGKPDLTQFTNSEPVPEIKAPIPDSKAPLIEPLPPIRAVDYQEPIKTPAPIKAPEVGKAPAENPVSPRDLPPIPEVPPLRGSATPPSRNVNRVPENNGVDVGIPDIKVPEFKRQGSKTPELPKIPDLQTPERKVSSASTVDVQIPDLPSIPTPGNRPATNSKDDLKIDLPDITPPKQNSVSKNVEIPDVSPPKRATTSNDIEIPDITPPTSPIRTTSAMKPIDSPKTNVTNKPADLPRDISAPTPIPEPIIENKSAPTHTILNSKTVTINYQVEGARGNNRIDFWATSDGGKSWIALRDESAGVAPARLTLPADGFYGIRIRPGAGSKPPEVGEDPDCVLEIDATKPTVNLMQPTLGTGSDEGTMLITWTASDKNLLSNSINLSYATKPEGPWEVIVSGYKNAGLYRWTMPSQLTGNIFVRLEASDRAGNVGQHDLKSPVAVEIIKPRVKVLGVGASR